MTDLPMLKDRLGQHLPAGWSVNSEEAGPRDTVRIYYQGTLVAVSCEAPTIMYCSGGIKVMSPIADDPDAIGLVRQAIEESNKAHEEERKKTMAEMKKEFQRKEREKADAANAALTRKL